MRVSRVIYPSSTRSPRTHAVLALITWNRSQWIFLSSSRSRSRPSSRCPTFAHSWRICRHFEFQRIHPTSSRFGEREPSCGRIVALPSIEQGSHQQRRLAASPQCGRVGPLYSGGLPDHGQRGCQRGGHHQRPHPADPRSIFGSFVDGAVSGRCGG